MWQTVQYLRQHDILLLTETRTQADVQHILPDHHIFDTPAQTSGRGGQGLLLAARHNLKLVPSLWHTDVQHGSVWIQLTPSDRRQSPYFVGVSYIPPTGSIQFRQTPADALMHQLAQQVELAGTRGHVLLAGDFNARIGSLDDSWVTDLDSSIPAHRYSLDTAVSGHSTQLMALCARTGLVLCTGRAPGDTPAGFSYSKHAGTEHRQTRIDHVMVSPELWGAIQRCSVDQSRLDSDHMPLVLTLSVPASAAPTTTDACTTVRTYVWDHCQQPAYSAALLSETCQQHLQQCATAAHAASVDTAAQHLHDAITTAAHNSMRQRGPCLRPKPGFTPQPSWFDAQCRQHRDRTQRLIKAAPQQRRLFQNQFQALCRTKRDAYGQRQLLHLTAASKRNLGPLFKAARPTAATLPPHLQTPSGWDALLQQLAAQPQSVCTDLPPAHVEPMDAAAAAALNSPITSDEVQHALQRLHNGRSGALLGYTAGVSKVC